jgi:hypothetical protein
MAIRKQGIGAFVCDALRGEGIDFYAHYNDPLVVGRKHKWVGSMRDITPYDKAKIERRIELQLKDAGYVFRECGFSESTKSYRGSYPMFIVRTC